MSFQAGAITGKLEFDIGEYTRGMMQVESIAHLFPSVVTSFLANPLLGAIDTLKDLAKTVVDFSVECVTGFGEAGHEIGEMSTALGMSAQSFQEVAAIFGTGQQALQKAAETLKFLGKSADDAMHGQETAQKAFARLGVSAEDLQMGMTDLPNLLMKVSDGLASLAGPERIGVGLDVLGRGAMESMGKLAKGSRELREEIQRFKEAGGILGEREISLADQYVDTIRELKVQWQSVKWDFGGELMKELLPDLKQFAQYLKDNKAEILSFFHDLAETVKYLAGIIKEDLKAVGDILHGFQSGGFAGGAGSFLKNLGGTIWNYSLPGMVSQAFGAPSAPGLQTVFGGTTVNNNVTVNAADDNIRGAFDRVRQMTEDEIARQKANDARDRVEMGL